MQQKYLQCGRIWLELNMTKGRIVNSIEIPAILQRKRQSRWSWFWSAHTKCHCHSQSSKETNYGSLTKESIYAFDLKGSEP